MSDSVELMVGRMEVQVSTLTQAFMEHRKDDQDAFNSLKKLIEGQNEKLDELTRICMQLRLDQKGLEMENDAAKTVGKYILTVMGGIAVFVGSCIIAAITGHMRFKF